MARSRKPDPNAELDPDKLEELEEENGGILRDGQSVRVSLFMKDGAINPDLLPHQKAKAMQQQTQDAAAARFGLSDSLQLHKPGFRYKTWDAATQERTRQAYQDAEAADRDAWRNPTTRLDYSEHTGRDPSRTGAGAPGRGSNASPGAHPYSAAAEGTSCTINGTPGVLVKQGNALVCQPRRSQDAASLKADAYAAYDEEQANAWRGPHR